MSSLWALCIIEDAKSNQIHYSHHMLRVHSHQTGTHFLLRDALRLTALFRHVQLNKWTSESEKFQTQSNPTRSATQL